MPIFAIIIEAMHSLAANKMRSGLTMLGMVIGVASVIVMVAIGQGSQRSIKQTIASLGSNLLLITPVDAGSQDKSTIFERDAERLRKLPIIQNAASMLIAPESLIVTYNGTILNSSVIGVTPSYFGLREWGVSRGTLFNDMDNQLMAPVTLIGESAAKKIFGQVNPVGKFIIFNKQRVQVIGVLKPKGQTLEGKDQDDLLILPQTLVRARLAITKVHNMVNIIFTKPRSEVTQETAILYITRTLRESHGLTADKQSDFAIHDVKSVAESALKAGRVMTILLGAIASVSLIVGGIGIMNIMLVCVTERTREIGIRKAIGASRQAILFQFLCEALLIALIGCMMGMFIGVGTILGLTVNMGIPVELNAWPVMAAFSASTLTGVFFGLYPALKASRLLPVEALKY